MTLLLAALLFAQDAKPGLAQAEQALNRHVLDARLELGDWCKAVGLPAEGVRHYRFVQKVSPAGTPWRTKAEKGLSGGWSRKPDSADAKAIEEYRRRLDAYARETADRAFACYKIARDPSWLVRTIEYDVDHPDARKERKEVRVDGFGWVPEGEAAAWKDAVSSKHFLLRTDRADKDAVLTHLERVHETFFKIFDGRFREPAEAIAVCWLSDAGAIDRIRGRLPGAPAPGTRAFYNQLTQVCYIFGDVATLTHEVTHALADLAAGPVKCILLAAGRRADAPDNYWVTEGLACYFATIRLAEGEPVFPGPLPPEDFDLAAFAKLDAGEFHKNLERNYVLAEALVRRYMDGPKRARFLDFVRDFYAGREEFPKELR